MCIKNSLEAEIFHLKSKVKGNEISFLKELKKAMDLGKTLTQEKFARELLEKEKEYKKNQELGLKKQVIKIQEDNGLDFLNKLEVIEE